MLQALSRQSVHTYSFHTRTQKPDQLKHNTHQIISQI
jgi:hypothetical protein